MAMADRTQAPERLSLCSENVETRDQAWGRLCDAHYDRLYRLVCRFGVEAGEVEDVVQRALVIAFKRLSESEEIRDSAAWLRGITVRVTLQQLRWRRLRETKRWLLPNSAIAAVPVITPEQSALAAEDISSVREVLKKMSPKLRNVLILCDIEEMKPGEVGRHLDISVETVRSRRRLAKEKFMTLWKKEQR